MADDPFTIKRLGPGDAALFHALNTLFGEAFDDAHSYCADRPSDAYLEDLLAKEHVIPLAALADGEPIGGLVAYELDKFEQARRETYIYDIAVRESHRRRGVATALIEHLRAIAAERGAWVIFVQADWGDEQAASLYATLGRREKVLHFDIPVNLPTRSA